jgi:tripartite-type tricarboxylate transporter receptor subunit TctC
MKFPHRRQFLHLAAGAAALPIAPRIAKAQAYPTRPVRIIVGFPPGGGTSIVARLIGQWLSERLGQPFVIENRPGAATNIATEVVVKAPPDGYTLLLFSASVFANAALYEKLSFNFIRDIAPVASIANLPYVMVINPSMSAKTVPEFIAYAKANPGKVSMASAGTGGGSHVSGELFKSMTGVDMVHVPYRGDAPAVTDLIAGQVQVYFSTLAASIEFIRAGKLRALAVTSATPAQALPDVPTVSEFVPGFEASGWQGLGAPKATPAEIINRLNKETSAALADPTITGRLADLGYTNHITSPAEFGKLIADETEKWGKVIRAANIKPE